MCNLGQYRTDFAVRHAEHWNFLAFSPSLIYLFCRLKAQ